MQTIKYKCDRCGKEMNYPSRILEPLENDPYGWAKYLVFKDVDFCDNCAAEAKDLYRKFRYEIKNWMKNKY